MKKADPRRWSFAERPIKLKPLRPEIHPRINSFDELSEEDKQILLSIKDVIVEHVGECELSLFGSRTKGNWDETSDYDVVVHKLVDDETQRKLRAYNFDVPVDLFFRAGPPTQEQVKF